MNIINTAPKFPTTAELRANLYAPPGRDADAEEGRRRDSEPEAAEDDEPGVLSFIPFTAEGLLERLARSGADNPTSPGAVLVELLTEESLRLLDEVDNNEGWQPTPHYVARSLIQRVLNEDYDYRFGVRVWRAEDGSESVEWGFGPKFVFVSWGDLLRGLDAPHALPAWFHESWVQEEAMDAFGERTFSNPTLIKK